MKRKMGFCLLCTLLLCVIVISTGAAICEAERVLIKEGPEAFWAFVTPKYGETPYIQEDYACLNVSIPNNPFIPKVDAEYFPQYQYFVQVRETNGVGFTIESVCKYTYTPSENAFYEQQAQLDSTIHVDPFGSHAFGFGYPRGGIDEKCVFIIAGTDDNGHPVEGYAIATHIYQMENNMMDAYRPSDTRNLRQGVTFEVNVAQDVWWVPAASLGDTRYTNADIIKMLGSNPEEKAKAVDTLYEALQLYQISNFRDYNDNVRVTEGKYNWEHHKPGYDAVRTNQGCCATSSNWLNYILAGDYEEVGFLAYSQTDGSGHIINYIKKDGFYYFIDLTHYRMDFQDGNAVESGNLNDYRSSDFISGNLHKAASAEAYVKYCRDAFNNPPAIFFMYQEKDCLPVDSVSEKNGGVIIVYPNTTDIQVVYDDSNDQVTSQFIKPPKKKVKWSATSDATIKAHPDYITNEVSKAPYAVGDTLSLDDMGERGLIEADGIEYEKISTRRSDFTFRSSLCLYGGNSYSYVDQQFPLDVHKDHIADLQSVWIGTIMLDLLEACDDVRIVRCKEENGTLIVTDVWQEMRNLTERVYLRRDENDKWQTTDTIWFLVSYRYEDIEFNEFGRFKCDIL